MKTLQLLFYICFTSILFAQQPYYNDVNLTLTGEALYNELQDKIDINNNSITYGDVRDTVKITDEDPNNNQNVLLVYGYNNSSCIPQRSRDKDDFGGSVCEYNREHVFARSNANPPMGDTSNSNTGITADPHNLRPSDQQMNGNRNNKKFATGSGNAGDVGSGNWYPGDEWKGDVARMMMYMYTRYGDRCLPSLNGAGATEGSTNMLQIYLQWNVEDPVDPTFEDQRNDYLETVYGNRNPFIDNPYLATLIWGGEPAEDRWNTFGITDNTSTTFTVYPNPSTETIWVSTNSNASNISAIMYTISGVEVKRFNNLTNTKHMDVSSLSAGVYLLTLKDASTTSTKRIVVK